jgi:regulator of CtrA degradation
MDEEIYGGAFTETPSAVRRVNPVSDQITLLNTAFARG